MCDTVTIERDGATEERVTTAVVDGLAAAGDVDPLDLGFSLGNHVDADALDDLFAREDPNVELTFAVEEYQVRVTSHGDVVVTRYCPRRGQCEAARA